MSYDLYLVRAPRGATHADIAALALGAAEAELPGGPPSAEAEAHKRVVTAALQASNPMLQPFAFDHAAIARFEGISEAEARQRYRHVELNGPEDGNGLQVTVYDDWATVTLPYWHQGAAASAVWDELWGYLRVLAERGGFTVYDPQLDRPLDLASDRKDAERVYADGVDATLRAAVDLVTSRAAPKPWWRFW